jgi:asparagine synthase (glutamine-hydrolysing)
MVMCGINGLWQAKKKTFSRDEALRLVAAMNDSLAHRGPDDEGVWSDAEGHCALGQRRLSIIDTSEAGRQPFASGDQRWWITFNGEIYNFREVRIELEAAGIRLRGRTDTEVLIEAIALWGPDALHRLDGMFAFAAYDTLTQSIFLARDPFGEKPLYYTVLSSGAVVFASELQALELLPGFDRTVDTEAVAELLSFQYIGAPRSIYASVKKLPPGHWMRIDGRGERRIERYFAFRPGSGGYTSRPRAELVDELEEILARSIKRRMIADVPLGAFLSGGVDSSTVCALARRKLGVPLQTFSTGFADASESEHLTAREFASLLGTDHHEQLIVPQAAEFLRGIGRVLDEPNADSSCLPVYMLSEFARQKVTVALSGDGGDELFGGYGRYFYTLADQATKQPEELREWCPGDDYYGPRILVSTEAHIAELFGFVPPGLIRRLTALRADIDGGQPGGLLSRLRRTDADHYMPGAVLAKVDRMSMRHGLEVRTPFLNVELARFAEQLPDDVLVRHGHGKMLLREVAYRYLPRELIDLPKQGFGLPMSDWGRTSLLEVATELLQEAECRTLPLFGREGIDRFLQRQRRPGEFSAYQVWALAMLESWVRHHDAVIPDLAHRRQKPTRRTATRIVSAARLGHDLWAVSTGSSDHRSDPRTGGEWEVVRPAIKARIAALQGQDGAWRDSYQDNLHLPGWGQQASAVDRERLAPLRGATLVFLDEDAWEKLDYLEMVKYASLGSARLIFGARYYTHVTEEVRLRHKSPATRVIHCALLFLRSKAIIGDGPRFSRLLSAARLKTVAGELCTSAGLGRLPAIPDGGVADRYMAFEGLRQLPPLPAGAGDIAQRGGGRYTISEQTLYFSATEPHRLHSSLFWLVERTPWTQRLLQFVRDRHVMRNLFVEALQGVRIADKVWLVSDHKSDDPAGLEQSLYRTTLAVLSRICELKADEWPASPQLDTVKLPIWGIPLEPGDTERLSQLRGATIVLFDARAARQLDYAELAKFAQLGVERLVFAAQDDPYVTEELRLQPQSLRTWLPHVLWLFLKSRTLISNRWVFALGGLARRYRALNGELCEAVLPSRIAGARGGNVSRHYAAFEGIRQLPPVQAAPEDIAESGGGRYAVLNRQLLFSPTEPMRRHTHPYWLVEQTPKIESLLRVVTEGRRPITWHADSTAFDELIKTDSTAGEFTLEPGDPIVIFTHALYPGGAERQWIYLAESLKNAGFDVTFVIYCEPTGDDGHYLPMLRDAGVPLQVVGRDRPHSLTELLTSDPAFQYCVLQRIFADADVLLSTVKTFERLKPKAVIAQLDHPNLLAGAAGILAGVPRIVMSFRNYNPTSPGFEYFYQDWFHGAYAALARSKRILLAGNAAVINRDYEDWIGIERSRAVRIPNAIDAEHFPVPADATVAATRQQLGIEPESPVLLGVFRLSVEKDPKTFIEVCARLIASYPTLQVLVAGVGLLTGELPRWVAERELSGSIRFLGRRSDINVLMSLSDLLLLTSQREGMPNAIIEAQSMGLPVVATDAGGSREALLHDVSGIICPVGDVDALCAACLRVLGDRALARRMGGAGRRYAATEFSPKLMAQRYIDLIAGRDPEEGELPDDWSPVAVPA